MTGSLDINGKKMLSIKYASERVGYSRDYVTKLAREKKIVATQVGRNWFVDLASLEHYSSLMATEQKMRQKQLSDERKQERQIKLLTERRKEARAREQLRLARRSKVLACAVLVLGVGAGVLLEQSSLMSTEMNRQVASAPLVQQVAQPGVDGTDVAATTSAGTITFSDETFKLSTLENGNEGILILPNATNSQAVNPEDLFSDEVKVFTDTEGNEYLARVDGQGNVVEKIPFVVVPVTNEQLP